MIDFAQARSTMVDTQVATSSVTDRRLLAALRTVPRERFVPEHLRPLAYIDRDITVAGGRVLSAPAPFARLVQLAAIEEGDKVLDAGCATGYSSAVLARLAGEVVALETDSTLAATARANLAAEGLDAIAVVEGHMQAAAEAPFDVVVVEDVVAGMPPHLLALLREGGRLVALVSANGAPPVAHLFLKQGDKVTGQAAFDTQRRSTAPRGDDAFVF